MGNAKLGSYMLLSSERSEQDTIRGGQLKIWYIFYVYII